MKLKTLLKLYLWPIDSFDVYDKNTGKFVYSTSDPEQYIGLDARINKFSVYNTKTVDGDNITILEIWM